MKNRLSFVNLLQGTYSTRDYSRGNCLPLAALPWGAHHWTFQTAESPWLFHPQHAKLEGIRLTHQPSPWMRDYASLLVSAFVGENAGSVREQASAYKITDAIVSPNYLRAELLRYGIIMEMSPTERGAVFQFTFGWKQDPNIRFSFDGSHQVCWKDRGNNFHAQSSNHSGGTPKDFGLELFGLFSVAPSGCKTTPDGAVFSFPKGTKQLELRLAGSFINQEMAQITLRRELQSRSFQEIRQDGFQIWERLLERIDIVEAQPDQLATFYSCLYRVFLFPRFLGEIDAQNRLVHKSPYDGGIHYGQLCTDNGFWDTFRTVYPLLALVYPDKLLPILEGWLNACKEAEWSPKWASPGLRDCMIGTHFDAVVAEAVSKKVVDWDVEEAYRYLWKNATVPSGDGRYGREALEDFIRLGYIASDRTSYAVSRTLDYSYGDFCVAQVAHYLGRRDDEKLLRRRAVSYRNLFDKSIGFMRGRLANGQWDSFEEFRWGGPYIEGGAWQHSFNVPHDPEGLAALCGGRESLLNKLDLLLITPPHFERGTYPEEIHEMTEMALAPFGQYAHSNQPVHNYLFFQSFFGERRKTSHWVHRVASELYTPDLLPGDDDNGEMSAWYVFACLGIYPFCPGKNEYVEFEPVTLSAELKIPEYDDILLFGKVHSRRNADCARNTISREELLRDYCCK